MRKSSSKRERDRPQPAWSRCGWICIRVFSN